jgi:uncharacterized protein YjbI with pentapeptide repeats
MRQFRSAAEAERPRCGAGDDPRYHDAVTGGPDRRRREGKKVPPQPDPPDLPPDLPAASPGERGLANGDVHEMLAFADVDWSDREATGAEIEACTFGNINLSRTKLRRGLIRDVRFERCDMANLHARDSSFVRVAVTASRMTGLSWLDDHLREVTFDGCRMDLSSFRASTFANVVFTDCRMEQADFGDADLRGARFERCNLSGAQFSGARMTGTRLAGCDLTEIAGVTSMRGALIASADVVALAFILAGALGITVEDDL